MYFSYGEKETAYLKNKDKKLGAVIEQMYAENVQSSCHEPITIRPKDCEMKRNVKGKFIDYAIIQ